MIRHRQRNPTAWGSAARLASAEDDRRPLTLDRSWLGLLGLLILLAACQTSHRFTPDEVSGYFLKPQEAPLGTLFKPDASGPANLVQFSQGFDQLRAGWAALNFQGGAVAIFMTAAQPPAPQAVTLGNGAMVFDTPDHASQALRLHRTLGVPRLTSGAVDVPVANLGDEAFAVRFDKGPEGGPGAICAFRIANVVFLVPASGRSVDPKDVIAIARTIASRATAAEH